MKIVSHDPMVYESDPVKIPKGKIELEFKDSQFYAAILGHLTRIKRYTEEAKDQPMTKKMELLKKISTQIPGDDLDDKQC